MDKLDTQASIIADRIRADINVAAAPQNAIDAKIVEYTTYHPMVVDIDKAQWLVDTFTDITTSSTDETFALALATLQSRVTSQLTQ